MSEKQDKAENLRASHGYAPRYSGPGKSGVCKCGHRWDEHHLGMVAKQEYIDTTGEYYIAQECEHFGCNELGGMMPNPDSKVAEWVPHCYGYEDSGA